MRPSDHWAYFPSIFAVAACLVGIYGLTHDVFASVLGFIAALISAAFWSEAS